MAKQRDPGQQEGSGNDAARNGEMRRVDPGPMIEAAGRDWHGRLKKPAKESLGGNAGQEPATDTGFSADYPALVAFITHTRWENGDPRAPGSFLMFTQDGTLTACLTDKAFHRKAFVAARTAQELLTRVEMGIRSDELPWRPEAGGSGGRR